MGVDISAELIINRPREAVAAYAMDPDKDADWVTGIKQARMLTDPPLAKGTQVERLAGFMGRRIEYVLEVVEHEPSSVMDMRSVKAPFPMHVTYRFDDADGATKASIRVQGGQGWIFNVAGPLMSMMVKRNISKDLRALKAVMESGQG